MANDPSVAATGSPLSHDTLRARDDLRDMVERGRAASEVNARQLALARATLASSQQLLRTLRDPLRGLRSMQHGSP